MEHLDTMPDETTALAAPGWTPLRMAVMAALVLVAVWLGWKAWDVNITMSCWKNEWPHLQVCDEINGRTPQEQVARLEERIRENPGDHLALVKLMVLAHQPGAAPHLDPAVLLERARKVAPQHVNVLLLSSQQAVARQQWPQAIDTLTRLSRYHDNAPARATLAEMIQASERDPQIAQALQASARADSGWLDGVLRWLPQAKVPTVAAMPLVDVLLEQQALTPKLGLALVRQLKAENEWETAHALWLYLWNRPLPLIFNGDFEQAFVPGGFDWETVGNNDHRSGAQISLVGRKERGQVLRVGFNGKSMPSPIVKQVLPLRPGKYRFSLSAQSTDLRSAEGLAWVFTCTVGGIELLRSAPVKATGRDWQKQTLSLEVPKGCGPAVTLSLQPQAAYEARAGMRGEMVFDALTLVGEDAKP
jgi:hypothetical protein